MIEVYGKPEAQERVLEMLEAMLGTEPEIMRRAAIVGRRYDQPDFQVED